MTNLLQDGLVLHRRGAVAEAAACYVKVLESDPSNADAHYYLGMIDCQHGRFTAGAERARQAIAADPLHARAHVLLGRALSALRQHDEALAMFDRAVVLNPDLTEAYSHKADALSDLSRSAEAIESYDRALALAPDRFQDWFNRGVALLALDRQEDAIRSFQRALIERPDFAEAHLQCAKALSNSFRYTEALEHIKKALLLDPFLPEAWIGQGNVLSALKQQEEALTAYDRALELKPEMSQAWLGRANVLTRLGRCDDAMAAYDRALALKLDFAEAWLGYGSLFLKYKFYNKAVSAYDKALSIKPDSAKAWLGRGHVFAEVKRYDDAIAAYDQALALEPNFAEAWFWCGKLLSERGRYADALSAFKKAITIKPFMDYAASFHVHTRLNLCDWSDLDREIESLLSTVRARKAVSFPFTMLSIPSSPADHLLCAQSYAEDQAFLPSVWRGNAYSHERIRVAYLSADFREHPVGRLAVGLFEHHDKSRFEVTGLSFGPDETSALHQRIKGAFEHFIDVRNKNDQEVADLMRHMEIDIAVDLMGYTQNSRPGIFAVRPAPIQVSYLGYLGTMGADFIDYIIADKIVLPLEQQRYYTEKIVHLPDCFAVGDKEFAVAPSSPTRQDVGLPAEGFVFCSFNTSYKLAKPTWEVWMNILRAVEGSVLWLLEANAEMAANLRREARRCGANDDRIVFAPRIGLSGHLARQRLADLFLDTTPYNAGATGVAALWSGLPILTVLGETLVGRMAASMLHAIELPELIAPTLSAYEGTAIKFASNSSFRASIKAKLASNRNSCPLFDAQRFARHVESAYETMWEAHRDRRRPTGFAVEPKG